mgnify:CR=1 FL=1
MSQSESISIMQPWWLACIVIICSMLTAGCIQLPGMHILSNTPDPITGQWIGGEPPASDRHLILYENQTYFFKNFFLGHGETNETGNWTKKGPRSYSLQSTTGEITDWVYDPFDDSLYLSGLPQMKYYRYKG